MPLDLHLLCMDAGSSLSFINRNKISRSVLVHHVCAKSGKGEGISYWTNGLAIPKLLQSRVGQRCDSYIHTYINEFLGFNM